MTDLTPGNRQAMATALSNRAGPAKTGAPVRFHCVVCGKEKPARDVTQLDVVRPN